MPLHETSAPLDSPQRVAPIDIPPDDFRAMGHALVDQVTDLLVGLGDRPVMPRDTAPDLIRTLLGDAPIPESGEDPASLLRETTGLLLDHSTYNGHPRFWGYISGAAAPIGILAELLAAAVNPNVGLHQLSPAATEIEAQTVRWVADLLGYPAGGDGLLVSGGNMANIVGLTAARHAATPWDVRAEGVQGEHPRLRVYASREAHTWLQSAADMLGLGTDSIRWIPTDDTLRMDATALREQLRHDREAGELPVAVIGTAGSVSTGAVDPLPEIAAICRDHGVWFHVDGAYGGVAVAATSVPADLAGLRDADSVAIDPHKWLYAPLEAGCVLVRDPHALLNAFSYHPPYYHFDVSAETNFYEHGPQNSRGFRALKVWLALRQAGRQGYWEMIDADIALARLLHERIAEHPALEPRTQALSITTFRYVPEDRSDGSDASEAYLNQLNEALLARLQRSGEVFLSNAVVDGAYLLRICIVNFRTSAADIEALPEIVARHGAALDHELREGQA